MAEVKIQPIAFPEPLPSLELRILGSKEYGIQGYGERGGQYQKVYTLYTTLQQGGEVSLKDQKFLSKFIRLMNEDSILGTYPEEENLIKVYSDANAGDFIAKAVQNRIKDSEDRYLKELTQVPEQENPEKKKKRFSLFRG